MHANPFPCQLPWTCHVSHVCTSALLTTFSPAFRDAILEAINSNQVVLVAGETGCGKTTQVPQFLLEQAWGASTTLPPLHGHVLSASTLGEPSAIQVALFECDEPCAQDHSTAWCWVFWRRVAQG